MVLIADLKFLMSRVPEPQRTMVSLMEKIQVWFTEAGAMSSMLMN